MAEINVSTRLAQARVFLRKSMGEVDPELPALLEKLEDVGASECWHKHGTFFEHLFNVYRNLKLWNEADSVARCGLFHSSYSNSYVNLALFKPDVDRLVVRDLIGVDAEELVHWFCIVPRQQLIFDMLLSNYTVEHLRELLRGSEDDEASRDLSNGLQRASLSGERKTRAPLVPPEGLLVKHVRTGEDLQVPRRLIAIFIVLTMADFADQLYGWQDDLFDNADGELSFGGNQWTALWPGDGRPGLWTSCISRMGALLNLILQDEVLFAAKETREGRKEALQTRPFAHIPIKLPPVFNNCSAIVPAADQVEALELYWGAFSSRGKEGLLPAAKSSLIRCSELNPFLAEPHVVLGQILLSEKKYEEAEKVVAQGLKLLLEWGTQWDKRMTWEGWISWARVLQINSKQRTWPASAWGLNSLGLVN